MQSYHNGPPVPVGPPDSSQFIHNAYQPPQHAIVPIPNPALQQYVHAVSGMAIWEAQQQCQKNELRSFFWNLISRNQFQNNDFHQFVTLVADYAEFLMYSRRMPIEQALQEAVRGMSDMLVAVTAQNHWQWLRQCIGPDQQQSISELLSAFQQTMAAMDQNRNMGGHMPPPNNFGGRPSGTGMGVYAGGQVGYAPSRSAPAPMGGMGAGSMFGPRTGPVPLSDTTQVGMHQVMTTRSRPGVQEISMTPGRGAAVVYTPNASIPPGLMSGTDPAAAAAVTGPVPGDFSSYVAVDHSGWPRVKDPLRPYDSMALKDGSEMRPARLSGWTTTRTDRAPYRLAYDYSKYVLFHVRFPDGRVAEMLKEKTEDMDYLENELNNELRAGARSQAQRESGTVMVPNWSLPERLRQKPGTSVALLPAEEEEGLDNDVPVAPVTVLDDVIQAHSLQEAFIKLTASVDKGTLPDAGERPIEFYFDKISPESTDKDYINAVRVLDNITSFAVLKAKMAAIKDRVPEVVFRLIDKRITDGLNHALKQAMGLTGWGVDSFFEDYDDLKALLAKKQGDVVVDVLEERATEVIAANLSVLSGDSYQKYLNWVGVEQDEEGEPSIHFLAFRDRCSVTQVPWKLEDLTLDINGGSVIPADKMPGLYNAVDAIFTRTLDVPVAFSHRYLMTVDRRLIEMRQGYFGKGSYLLFEIP